MDNVVRRARVSLPDYTDDNVEGVRALLKHISNDPEVDATTIATVGTKVNCPKSRSSKHSANIFKGYDGFLYAIKL